MNLVHDKAQRLEGIDVPVDGALGDVQFLGKLLNRVIGVPGHEAHEPENALYSWKVHNGY